MKQDWEIKKLKEVLKIQNGYAFDAKLFTIEEGTPLIRIRDIKVGVRTVTNFNGKYDKKYEVNAGDFLIGMDGDFGCYEWKGDTALLNQRVCRLQEFSSKLYPRFLFYGINKYLKAIEEVTAFATVKHISSKQIENIEIPLPPFPEQQRIVAILDEAFAKIEKAKANAEQNLKNAKELFESFLQGVFENGNWEEKTLNEISENLDSKRVPVTKNVRNEGLIPYYGASGIVDYVSDYLFDEDLLCVSEDGANLLARTYPIAFSITGKTWVNNHAHVLRFKNRDSQKFVELYLNSIKLDDFVSGMAQPKLNQTMLNKIPIPFPPLQTQQTIVQKLVALKVESKKLEAIYQKKIKDLEELKKSVLQKAFSGELKYKKNK